MFHRAGRPWTAPAIWADWVSEMAFVMLAAVSGVCDEGWGWERPPAAWIGRGKL